LINEGVNELTAKLSCDIGPFNVTKYDSEMLMVYLRRTKGHPINRPPMILHVEKLWHTEGSVKGITKTLFLQSLLKQKRFLLY
jgi:hypothetical protein